MNKIIKIVIALICILVLLALPSVNVSWLMDGTQSGKSFAFLFLMFAATTVIIISFHKKTAFFFQICRLDASLFAWTIYTLSNALLHQIPRSLLLFDFVGLVVLYFILRYLNNAYILPFLIVAIAGGLVQALYGNMQLWGYFPANSDVFSITGSFFNPGPYAGYLAFVFSVTLGFNLFKHQILFDKQISKTGQIKNDALELLSLATGLFTLLAIIASQSRGAFLTILVSAFYLVLVKFKAEIRGFFKKFTNSALKKTSVYIVALLLAGSICMGFYYVKKGSADGRLLIWKVSISMFSDNFMFGYGFDRFKANYMEYQAAFFGKNHNIAEAMVAGDTNYAFNEPLQQIIENGIIGFLLLLIPLIVVFGYNNTKSAIYNQSGGSINGGFYYKVIAKAGIISVLTFSLFSYPAQILSIKIGLVLCFSVIANYSAPITIELNSFWHRYMMFTAKSAFVALYIAVICILSLFFKPYLQAYERWNVGYRLYQLGVYSDSIEAYEQAYPVLKNNGDFLTNYGKALSLEKRHAEALVVLTKAVSYYPNTVAYTAMGDSYMAQKRYVNAEKSYYHAWYMIPSRFYPKYLLAKLYQQSGQNEKAIAIANELLHMKVKIHSEAIREIKVEMAEIIKRAKTHI